MALFARYKHKSWLVGDTSIKTAEARIEGSNGSVEARDPEQS
jgi:hypothetical protein